MAAAPETRLTLSSLLSPRRLHERMMQLPAVARALQTLLVIAGSLKNDPITLRAAALTYLTILSLVPLLAVVFSIFQAVVGTHALEARLQEYVFQNLAVGVQGNVSQYIAQAIERASGFGIVGFALLLFSAVSLMGNVESALNHTFRAPRQRSVAVRFGVYWCILTLGPILLALSLAATALLQSSGFAWLGPIRRAIFEVLPAVVTVAAFTLMYAIIPAVPVSRKAAVTGAVVAGVAWETAKILYTYSTSHSARNGAIYGSLSAIPIFLVWTYLSWIIVLFGARVAYAVQAGWLAVGSPAVLTPLGRELLVARVMREVAASFVAGRTPPSALAVATSIYCPEPEVVSSLERLADKGLIREVAGGGWVPARPPSQIQLAEVRMAARAGEEVTSQARDLVALRQLWNEADGAASKALASTVGDLLDTPEG